MPVRDGRNYLGRVMTPADLARMQETLGLDVPGFAAFLAVGERSLRRWRADALDMPLWIIKFGPLLVEISDGKWGPEIQKRIVADHDNFLKGRLNGK